jgi:hypothetical protein
MGRYRGQVEQARRELRAAGLAARDARQLAPHLAELHADTDRQIRPYPVARCPRPRGQGD